MTNPTKPNWWARGYHAHQQGVARADIPQGLNNQEIDQWMAGWDAAFEHWCQDLRKEAS